MASPSRRSAATAGRRDTRRSTAALDSALQGEQLRTVLSDIADQWLRERLGDEADVALAAVGGYGRRELLPGSDLDLVLLHAGRSDVKSLADSIWYPIWDAGINL